MHPFIALLMLRVRYRAVVHVACLLAALASRTVAQPTPRIVNGTLTSSFPSTGALLIYDDPTQTVLIGLCSGTLIGCRTFVTAAHCVCNDADDITACMRSGPTQPERLRVFFQQAGYVQVTDVAASSDFEFGEAGDIAVLQLQEAVVGIEPTGINTIMKPEIGAVGTIVGFGRTLNQAATLSDAGIKREGKVTVSDCDRVVPDETHVCWQFLGDESSTCSGDSGGPLLMDFGNGVVLAGVTSGGVSDTCAAPDRSFQTDVFHYADFVGANTDDCSDVVPSNAELLSLLGIDGQLSRLISEQRFDVTTPIGTTSVRFALNGQLSGTDFDLYVRRDEAPTTTTYDCADLDTASFGVCASAAPPGATTWHILVRRIFGTGTFQLNVTALVVPTSPTTCSGDCDDDGRVSVEDLVTGVNVVLGRGAVTLCSALDTNNDGVVLVDELVAGVANLLGGCTAP